jgi:hypothetical protein
MIDGLMSSDDGGNKKRRAEKQWRREEVEAGLDERDEPVVCSCAFRCRSHLTMLIGCLSRMLDRRKWHPGCINGGAQQEAVRRWMASIS